MNPGGSSGVVGRDRPAGLLECSGVLLGRATGAQVHEPRTLGRLLHGPDDAVALVIGVGAELHREVDVVPLEAADDPRVKRENAFPDERRQYEQSKRGEARRLAAKSRY